MLNLEHLAAHRGSLLGAEPDRPQPAQKLFESEIYSALELGMDPGRLVWVEAESPRLGRLTLPLGLWRNMQVR